MTSDLRQRLAAELLDFHVHYEPDAEDEAQAELAVFAAWLRERAETEHDPNCSLGRHELQHYPGEQICAHFDARWRRDFAITLADEIERREASDGD